MAETLMFAAPEVILLLKILIFKNKRLLNNFKMKLILKDY